MLAMNESTTEPALSGAAGKYPELVWALEQSYTDLEDSVRGLDDNLCSAKPGGQGWSIVEVIEHLGLLEKRITPMLAKLSSSAPSSLSPDDQGKEDAALVAKVISRGSKLAAPESVCPNGRFESYRKALEDFKDARQRTLAYVKGTGQDLTAGSMPHIYLGPLSGHQWIQVIAAHTQRHAQQIVEVKEMLLSSLDKHA